MATQESANLKAMKKQRSNIKAQVTRIVTFINERVDFDIEELDARKTRLIELRDLFDKVQSIIEMEDDVSDHVPTRDQFESQFFSTIAWLNKNIKLLGAQSRPASTSTLNEFNLPSLVHNNVDLPAVQKFHLLKNSLRGEISYLISALNASEANYNVAWELLQKKCNRPRQIINSHLKALFELPEINRESAVNLRTLSEQAQMHVNTLKTAKQPVDNWDAILVYLIAKKLDKITKRAWERTLENEEMPTFGQLINFINKQARGDEPETENFATSHKFQNHRSSNKYNKGIQNYATSINKGTCYLCKEGHKLYKCPKFLKLTVRERFDEVRKIKLCFKCLKGNYNNSNCSFKNCFKCGRPHNLLLHFSTPMVVSKTEENSPSTSSGCVSDKTVMTITNDSEVLLGTALIKVYEKYNNEHVCRILLDSASQAHFITNKLAKRLNLKNENIDWSLSGINKIKTKANVLVEAKISSLSGDYNNKIKCVAVDIISGLLPANFVKRENLKIPKNIQLADPHFCKPAEVDMLLGNSIFYKLLTNGQIRLNDDKVILQATKLGWIVTGDVDWKRESQTKQRSCFLTLSLDQQLNKFWEVEEVSNVASLSLKERNCEDHFIKNTSRDSSGRYTVRLPFNETIYMLGESRTMAMNRFLALERKLHKNPSSLKQYSEFLEEYESLGHMSKIVSDDISKGYYLPHHAIFKESSITTKIRVVFDASAKSSTGVCLNDILLVGPTIQDTLFSILLRFRTHAFVLTADIEKVFRQIQVHPEDRKFQKILWRTSPDQPIATYKLNTVTYGTASAPFIAVRCLKQLANDESDKFPIAAKIFQRDFYVDDILTEASDLKSSLILRNELIGLSKLGGFNLRQWSSNDNRLLNDLTIESNDKSIRLDSEDNRKMLGIYWSPSSDNICYVIKSFEEHTVITKRKANIGWDETVPQELLSIWLSYKTELHLLSKFNMNRYLHIDNAIDFQLHGFSDASESAYGACVFIRSSNREGKHKVALLCAKSRVAPVKTISLPRLELCAARLLANLYIQVKGSLTNVHFSKVRFWSDSTIVLHWLKTPPHKLKVFVANRVNKIQTLTDTNTWFHVSSADNPADAISRGQSPSQFLENSLWLNGLYWLSCQENLWQIKELHEIEISEKRNVICLVTSKDVNDVFDRFSSICKLNRVFAYALRFYYNLKNKKGRTGLLAVQEVNDAHLKILQLVQEQAFAIDMNNLRNGRALNRNSKVLNLNPFIDDSGSLR
ncbi:PREDICTED: uncharacterized protein LOC107193148, partial [Dufourea novaeangliae]|uniref:uncharacterized protein LOC107193148 n=1 Tax=Dufourea novaeangliae TaxID=178035 RepID=UPI0007671930